MKLYTRIQIFLRSFFLQTGWNYAKFQNIGLAFVMLPFLKQLYKNQPEKLNTALKRYLESFNTQPIMASFCFGTLARQEDKVARAKTPNQLMDALLDWEGIKRALSITTASIGDRLFWGALKPLTLLLALFIWLVLGVNFLEVEAPSVPAIYAWMGAGAAFVAFNTVALFVKWVGILIAYTAKESSCFGLIKFDWNKTIYYAKRFGIYLALGMLFFGFYHFIKDFHFVLDFHLTARLLLVLCFVCCSLLTRRLRIPNMYLYLIAVAVFNVVCYL